MAPNSSGWRKWDTPFYLARQLANVELTARSTEMLVVEMQDLETTESFRITFKSVLGFRFEKEANTQALMNSFIVRQSSWVSAMMQKPFRTKDISKAVHYIISTMDGQLDVVCLERPRIETHPSKTSSEQ